MILETKNNISSLSLGFGITVQNNIVGAFYNVYVNDVLPVDDDTELIVNEKGLTITKINNNNFTVQVDSNTLDYEMYVTRKKSALNSNKIWLRKR
jgi:hypothetical protein